MSEKRFTLMSVVNFDYGINDNDKPIGSLANICDLLNGLHEENKQLKKENQEYKSILQDIGMLMSDDGVKNIRNEMANKFLKPLFKSNGFDVDIDCTNGFTIIPKGDFK